MTAVPSPKVAASTSISAIIEGTKRGEPSTFRVRRHITSATYLSGNPAFASPSVMRRNSVRKMALSDHPSPSCVQRSSV